MSRRCAAAGLFCAGGPGGPGGTAQLGGMHAMAITAEARQGPSPTADTGVVTVATLARDWARRAPHQVAIREKDLGIWQELHLGSGVERHSRRCPCPARPRRRARRPSVDPLRGPSRVGRARHRHGRRARRSRSGCTRRTRPPRSSTCSATPAPPSTSPRTRSRSTRCSPSPATGAGLKRIVYLEPRGLATYEDNRLVSWDDLLELGRQHRVANPGAVERRMAEAANDDVVTLVYTSGTTGPPKGAMLTNANFAFVVGILVSQPERMPDGRVPGPSDLVVTYLPLCHVAERIFSTWHMVGAGVVLNFAESIETVTANLGEVQPTLFFAVPRIWEKLHAVVADQGQRRQPDEAFRVPPRECGRRRRSAAPRSPTAATTRRAAGCATRSGIRCCSGRCRNGSDCAGAATHLRARHRSPRRSSSSSWASASRSSSCTG